MIRVLLNKAVPAAPLGAAFLLQACATSSGYPSLAVRDVERVEGSGTPAAGSPSALPALPPASADLTTRLAGLVDVVRQAHARFEAKQAATQRAITMAGATRSDSWTAAQVALSDLQTARSGALTAVAELDRLYVDERTIHPEQVSPAATAIGTARDQVNGWLEQETAVIVRLDARLKN